MSHSRTCIGVIGGSGVYAIDGLSNIKEERISTGFGEPSDTITRAKLSDVEVLFLPRHGRHHSLLPSEINYRANVMALKMLGASWCISISAVGSLREEIHPGDIVIPHQLIDRTKHRAGTFFGGGLVAHVSFADPYCPVLRDVLLSAGEEVAAKNQFRLHSGGTYVCMEGPAFSTRAESKFHRQLGADLIGMTALPEARLAREAELAYATIALVTDYDCWREDGDDVSIDKVTAILQQNATNAGQILRAVVPALKNKIPSSMAADSLKNAIFCDISRVPSETLDKLMPIIGRYIEKSR